MTDAAPACLVVATAGHVDHGKSSLVRALTGTDPDVLAEEQRRGLTIELGFAWCPLPSGRVLSLIDVPGHERFVGTALSGLGPVGAVVLVVAADQGWQEQTQEHVDALVALGVRDVVLVVSRSDLADPAPARADALARLAAAGLTDVPAVAVASPRDGQTPVGAGAVTDPSAARDGRSGPGGHADLLRVLDDLAGQRPPPDPGTRVRLWVDRSFSVSGRGRVVTGTLTAGRVRTGDVLDVSGRAVRVRGVQSLGRDLHEVTGPGRVALRVDTDLRRGDVLTTRGAWHLTDLVDVSLTKPLPGRLGGVHVHVGTADHVATLRALGEGHARVRLPGPVPLKVGDRLLLRDPGGRGVLAGAVAVDVDPPPLDRRGAAAARATDLEQADPALEVRRRGAVRTGHLRLLGAPVPTHALEIAGWLVMPDRWATAQQALTAMTGDPVEGGPTTVAAASRLDLPEQLVGPLARAAGLGVARGRVVREGVHDLGTAEVAVREVEARLEQSPFDAPDRGDLARLGLGPRELAAATRAGRLLTLAPDLVLLPSAPDRAVHALQRLADGWSVGDAARAMQTSRRVVVPLLEHLDAQGATRRTGAVRQLIGTSSTWTTPASS